jgi:hypothetical protein
MGRAHRLSDMTTSTLPVDSPLAGATSSDFGVCLFCNGPTQPGYRRCFCCATVAARLGMPLVPVVSVTTYRLGDEMHRTLRRYKDAPSATTRRRAVARCAGLLSEFVDGHRQGIEALAGGPWDTVVTVPSSTTPGRFPVDAVVSAVGSLAADHRRLLVKGTGRLDHMQASRSGFAVDPGVDPTTLRRHRALVVDDSYTTGARAQSAATALRLVGMGVGVILSLGRVVAPRSCPWHAAFWDAYVEGPASVHKVGCTAPEWERE